MQLDENRNDQPDRTWAQRSIALKIRRKSRHDKNWVSLRPKVSRYRLSLFHFQYLEAFLESIGMRRCPSKPLSSRRKDPADRTLASTPAVLMGRRVSR
jgi:hypothetical protein